MQSIRRFAVPAVLIGMLGATLASPAAAEDDTRIPGHYIVVFEDSVKGPAVVAERQVEQRDGELGLVYRNALKGYSAELSRQAVKALRNDPRVKYIQPDHKVVAFAQTVPSGVKRVFATENASLDIDETDDVRVDADVAVLDTGIDHEHPDLNVVGRTNCVPANEQVFPGGNESTAEECIDGQGVDKHGHGTHVAGTIGALDNEFGVVGTAPGARLWSVRVLGPGGGATSWVIAGIDWVTATREDEDPENDIEVANMSLGCFSRCASPAESEAIASSVDHGVVYVAAAGNQADDAKYYMPASSPDVITVAALQDFDGDSGGAAPDDSLSEFSNFGETIEIVAPGNWIKSTLPKGGYQDRSGTSMAAPHVSGAAAVLASQSEPVSRADAELIREQLLNEGSLDRNLTKRDKRPAPVLYMGDSPLPPEVAISPPITTTDTAAFHGAVNMRGSAGEHEFEYGPTSEYGESTPPSGEEIEAGAGYLGVAHLFENLQPRATSHVRLVATSGLGSIQSQDRAYSTRAAMPSYTQVITLETESEVPVAPRYLAAGSEGDLWLLDSCCELFHLDSTGDVIDSFELYGTGEGQILGTFDIAVDPGGNVWVAGAGGQKAGLLQLSPEGELLGEIEGSFQTPDAIAADGDGDIWVVDATQDRIYEFDQAGEELQAFGVRGSDPGELELFGGYTDIAFDPDGDLWVIDAGNHRIQQLSDDGDYLSSFSVLSPLNELKGAHHRALAVDDEGDVWISDSETGSVRRFEPNGHEVGSIGRSGSGDDQFELESPMGLAVGKGGDVWAADIAALKRWSYSSPHFEATIYPAEVTGEGFGEFHGKAGSVRCVEMEAATELAKNTDSMVLDASNGGCKDSRYAYSTKSTVEMNSCQYTIEVRKAGPPYRGRLGVFCDQPGDAIEVDYYGYLSNDVKCTMRIPAQTSRRGMTLSNRERGFERHVMAAFDVDGFQYTLEGSGYGCSGSPKSYENGRFIGQLRLSSILKGWGSLGLYVDGREKLPEIVESKATGVKPLSATLQATVNANASSTSYYFEYGKSSSYGATAPAVAAPAGSGTSDIKLSEQIGELEPDTTYHARLVSTNEGGTSEGADFTFTTLSKKTPSANMQLVGPWHDGAKLMGSVNPNGLDTSYRFEYGKTEAYGSAMPVAGQAIGSGTTAVVAYDIVDGLAEEAIYHVRLTATNSAGTSYSSDMVFETPSKSDDGLWADGAASEDPENSPRFETSFTGALAVSGSAEELAIGFVGGACSQLVTTQLMSLPSKALPLIPPFLYCKDATGEGRPFNFVSNGCETSFSLENVGPPYSASFEIACGKESDRMEITLFADYAKTQPICTTKLMPQKQSGVDVFNEYNMKERRVRFVAAVDDLQYEASGACVGEPEMRSDGTLEGEIALEALEE